jgi:hypothetical protein
MGWLLVLDLVLEISQPVLGTNCSGRDKSPEGLLQVNSFFILI